MRSIDPLGEIMEKNQKWWRDIAPPQGEDPILLLYLPWNLVHHGDVVPERRKWLLEHFNEVLDVFEGAGIPVHMSYQQIDIDALELTCGFDPERLQNLPLLSAPFSHVLCGLIGDEFNDHIDWQIDNGLQGNVVGPNGEMGYFFPEWDIPANTGQYFRQDPKAFLLSVGAFATLYSECAVGDRVDASVMQYDAIGVGAQTVVPMKGVDVFHKTWFAYQLNDSEGNLAAVIQSVRDIVESGSSAGKVVTLFVDGESVLVGGARSFWDQPLKGYEIWERFFLALKTAGLDRYFHGMERAYPRWNASAKDAKLPPGKSIGRHYSKWCSWKAQEKVKGRYARVLPKKGEGYSKHFLGGLDAVSDRLSVINALELGRKNALRTFVDKDGVTFSLDCDATIPLVGHRATEVLSGKGGFLTQMRKLRGQAAQLLEKEGKPFGDAEIFTLDLMEKLYGKYEEYDVR